MAMTDWPQEIRKVAPPGSLLKKRGPKQPHKNSRWREDRDGADETHAANVRKLPCCVCRSMPGGEVHHLKSGTGERGMGVRSSDKWGIPLCHTCHMDVERAGTKQERAHLLERGIDPHELAQALWINKGDLARMTAVLIAQWENG